VTAAKHAPTPLICDDCGKQMQPFTLPAAHDCDGGEALRKAAHELFAPCVDLIERTIAKAGTGVLRGVFEVAAERDRLRNSHDALVAALEQVRISVGHGDAKDIATRALAKVTP
jgi:hypothetical protein